MAIVRAYVMIAASDKIEALDQALRALAAKVAGCEGTGGTELYQDLGDPARFTFLERWASVEAQKAAGQALGKDAFAPIMAALASPPEAATLNRLA